MYLQMHRLKSELEWLERQIREETHRPVPDFVKLQGFRRKRTETLHRLAALRRSTPLTA